MGKYEQAIEILKKYEQEQLLSNYQKLSEENQVKLIEQILKINFEQVKNLYESTKNKETTKEVNIEPTPYIEKAKLSNEEVENYRRIGVEEIKRANYAVVTMAGGQRN